jgi:hypothetical protein
VRNGQRHSGMEEEEEEEDKEEETIQMNLRKISMKLLQSRTIL